MATSSFESASPTVPESYQGRMSSSGGMELCCQSQASYPQPLTTHSLPISIELHHGNMDTNTNSDQRSFVVDSGDTLQRPPVQREPKPENHMTLSFLSTLFCACPCGLMSLCHAIQVDSDYYHGNTVGANYNSQQAWRWGFASVVLGSLCLLIVIFYYLILMAIHIT